MRINVVIYSMGYKTICYQSDVKGNIFNKFITCARRRNADAGKYIPARGWKNLMMSPSVLIEITEGC